MNRHGRRFIELRDFKSHATSLNVKRLRDDELEFYEQHCLLLPAVVPPSADRPPRRCDPEKQGLASQEF